MQLSAKYDEALIASSRCQAIGTCQGRTAIHSARAQIYDRPSQALGAVTNPLCDVSQQKLHLAIEQPTTIHDTWERRSNEPSTRVSYSWAVRHVRSAALARG
jgi:hypothetical protein